MNFTGESMNVGKSGKFLGVLHKNFRSFSGDKSFSRNFQDLEKLTIKFQDFAGVARSCANPDYHFTTQLVMHHYSCKSDAYC
jgi:hypothetical protein